VCHPTFLPLKFIDSAYHLDLGGQNGPLARRGYPPEVRLAAAFWTWDSSPTISLFDGQSPIRRARVRPQRVLGESEYDYFVQAGDREIRFSRVHLDAITLVGVERQEGQRSGVEGVSESPLFIQLVAGGRGLKIHGSNLRKRDRGFFACANGGSGRFSLTV